MGIPMLKIRRPQGHLIFHTGIPILVWHVYIESSACSNSHVLLGMCPDSLDSFYTQKSYSRRCLDSLRPLSSYWSYFSLSLPRSPERGQGIPTCFMDVPRVTATELAGETIYRFVLTWHVCTTTISAPFPTVMSWSRKMLILYTNTFMICETLIWHHRQKKNTGGLSLPVRLLLKLGTWRPPNCYK